MEKHFAAGGFLLGGIDNSYIINMTNSSRSQVVKISPYMQVNLKTRGGVTEGDACQSVMKNSYFTTLQNLPK